MRRSGLEMLYPDINRNALDHYIYFVDARQQIWHRRFVLEQEPPWTENSILREAWFTNDYRELDPGTKWVQGNVFNNLLLNREDKAFWSLFYRFAGSNRHSFQFLSFTPVAEYDPRDVAKQLNHAKEHGISPFGGAYNVHPIFDHSKPVMGGIRSTKVGMAAFGFREIAKRWSVTYEAITKEDNTPEQIYEAIRASGLGVGPFVAHQAFVDYCQNGIVYDYRNDFTVAGPGALRGIKRIFGERTKPLEKMVSLHKLHLTSYRKSAPWLDHPLYLTDIQNTLCEFSKYMRLIDGKKVKRKYRVS